MAERGTRLGGGALVGVLVAAEVLAAQPVEGNVQRALLRADLSRAGAAARIRIDYRLDLPEGTSVIPLTALVPTPARLAALTARTPVRRLNVELPESPTAQRTGRVSVPAAAAGPLTLVLEYELSGAVLQEEGQVSYRVPVIAVDWPSIDPLPGTFVAHARTRSDVQVVESFPTTLRRASGPPGMARWEVELSVVPAYLTLRGRTGAAPPLVTLPRIVDGAVLGVLGLLLLFGWIRLRNAR